MAPAFFAVARLISGPPWNLGTSFALSEAVEKLAEELSAELDKANHPKGWDAKPLALIPVPGKVAGLPGGNRTSVECISVGLDVSQRRCHLVIYIYT
jgi:hypothetical protein